MDKAVEGAGSPGLREVPTRPLFPLSLRSTSVPSPHLPWTLPPGS